MSNVFRVEVVKRHLRDYYNEVMEITQQLDDEEMSIIQSEKALIQLDEKYAKLIEEELK